MNQAKQRPPMVPSDETGFHKCPAADCQERVPNPMAFCRRHWYMVPIAIRKQIWDSYHGNQGGTASHLQLIERAAIEIAKREEVPVDP